MSQIQIFETDGCSGNMSRIWRLVFGHPPPWEAHCIEHDMYYWRGGDSKARRQADLRLAAGVVQAGHPFMAMLMYYAVRIGGHPSLPLPWRWAYGRPKGRGYIAEDARTPLPQDVV